MSVPSDRCLRKRPELVCSISEKLEASRDSLRDKFAREDLESGSSTNLDVPEKHSDLGNSDSDMSTDSVTVLSKEFNPNSKSMFKLLNVAQFIPEEIEVKVVGQRIVVHCKHDEKFEEHCWMSREFTRRFEVPEGLDLFTVKSVLNNGVLVITASKKISIRRADSQGRQIQIGIEKP